MPSLHNYDENGLIDPSTSQNKRVTTFDSFMQGLDDEYDKRKEMKKQPAPARKSAESKKVPALRAPPPAPLTLEGPIAYRDQQKKKSKKKKSPVKENKRPVIVSSSSDDDEPSQMVYDEDEAWY